jgi:uncharacterized protein (TIGR03435 family)
MVLHLARKLDRRMPLLTAVGLLAVATPVVFGSLHAVQSPAESQAETTPAMAFVFEVASIKPNRYSTSMLGFGFVLERFTARGATLQLLIREAYGVEEDQISGGPRWLNSERYDIEAKADKSVADELRKLSFDQRVIEYRRMLQALLADRFKLTLHRETKELPVYALVIAKNGPKLQGAKPDDMYPEDIDGNRHGDAMRVGRGLLGGQGVSIAFLVQMLSQQQLGRPVLDMTGLTGKYDFTLQWTPDERRPRLDKQAEGRQGTDSTPSAGPSELSIFTAIQEQLGLKLESKKGPVEVLVIDHVDEPSEN